jgi:hypothetical protein
MVQAPCAVCRATFVARFDGPATSESLTAEQLQALENRDVPSIDRASDEAEARADEKQDVSSSLNFPLHWTAPEQSWNYLFDFSTACELLAPRPDDLVLDFAAGTCSAERVWPRTTGSFFETRPHS